MLAYRFLPGKRPLPKPVSAPVLRLAPPLFSGVAGPRGTSGRR